MISLGSAKFDAKTGGGATREALIDFSFSIGGTDLTASGAYGYPVLDGLDPRDPKQVIASFAREYTATKPQRIASAQLDPQRRRHLEQRDDRRRLANLDGLANFFSFTIPVKKFDLAGVAIGAKSGVLAEIANPKEYDWRIENLNFGRFDGDTLTGRCGGTLRVERR